MSLPKRLLVQNHLYLLPELISNYDEVLYCPIYKSLAQEKYVQRIFSELVELYPDIKFVTEVELFESDDVLTTQAWQEKKTFGSHLLNIENRLFEQLEFDVPESFTAFRKKAEKILPERYEVASKPFLPLAVNEVDYYFSKKELPLNYFDTRNDMVGRDFSTKFSTLLSHGLVNVRYLYNQVKDFELKHESNKSTYWIVFELLWREFFYWHYQKHSSKYFSENGLKDKKDFSDFPIYTIEDIRPKSPTDFFSAALNELEQTGFLSNRARQIFASQWLNDLNLNWRSGADLFETYLVDYDVYSNYGNWMYLAGVGVDPRGKRYFNVEKQLQNYDPEGSYLKKWL